MELTGGRKSVSLRAGDFGTPILHGMTPKTFTDMTVDLTTRVKLCQILATVVLLSYSTTALEGELELRDDSGANSQTEVLTLIAKQQRRKDV